VSLKQFWESRTIFKRGQVVLTDRTPVSLYFMVKGKYSVKYDRRVDTWSCCCVHGSHWSKQESFCKHVRACRMFMNERLREIEKKAEANRDGELSDLREGSAAIRENVQVQIP
jgi:hypothetical protein